MNKLQEKKFDSEGDTKTSGNVKGKNSVLSAKKTSSRNVVERSSSFHQKSSSGINIQAEDRNTLTKTLSFSRKTLKKLAGLCGKSGEEGDCGTSKSKKGTMQEEEDEYSYPGAIETLCESMQALSLNLFELPEEPHITRKEDINTLLEVDTNYLNFGSFYPGKIFKCTIAVKNLTNSKRVFTLSYADMPTFTKPDMLKTFINSTNRQIVSLFNATPELPNSEMQHRCWYFMLGGSKSFEKKVTVTLAPHGSTQIGIVIKSPCVTRSEKFYSLLRVNMAEGDTKEKAMDPEKGELSVLSVAEVITPKLECCRELIHDSNKLRVIPLVVKMEGPIQRVKIPFKNGGCRDLDLMLNIVRFPTNNKEAASQIDYHCIPATVKITANSMAFITLGFSAPTTVLSSNGKKPLREQRVLIAKIKDTQLIYSYILDCTFI